MNMICYACNKTKWFQNWMPFAICDECKSPEAERQEHIRNTLPLYWVMKPAEQDGIRDIAFAGPEVVTIG